MFKCISYCPTLYYDKEMSIFRCMFLEAGHNNFLSDYYNDSAWENLDGCLQNP